MRNLSRPGSVGNEKVDPSSIPTELFEIDTTNKLIKLKDGWKFYAPPIVDLTIPGNLVVEGTSTLEETTNLQGPVIATNTVDLQGASNAVTQTLGNDSTLIATTEFVQDALGTIDLSNMPTADEKAALAGTSGTPSGTNPYVTDSDQRLLGAPAPVYVYCRGNSAAGANTNIPYTEVLDSANVWSGTEFTAPRDGAYYIYVFIQQTNPGTISMFSGSTNIGTIQVMSQYSYSVTASAVVSLTQGKKLSVRSTASVLIGTESYLVIHSI